MLTMHRLVVRNTFLEITDDGLMPERLSPLRLRAKSDDTHSRSSLECTLQVGGSVTTEDELPDETTCSPTTHSRSSSRSRRDTSAERRPLPRRKAWADVDPLVAYPSPNSSRAASPDAHPWIAHDEASQINLQRTADFDQQDSVQTWCFQEGRNYITWPWAEQGSPPPSPLANQFWVSPFVNESCAVPFGQCEHPDETVPPEVSCATPEVEPVWPSEEKEAAQAPQSLLNGRPTTVIVRCIPPEYSSGMVLKLLDQLGFAGVYDYLYLPMGFLAGKNLCYAFVNLISHEEAVRFMKALDGFTGWQVPSDKVAVASWAQPCQGLAAHVERYRNSPVMHPSMPDEYKPMIFEGGQRVPFPQPTKPIKAPKVRVKAVRKLS